MCIGCRCNICALNVNLDLQYFTPGEVDSVCLNCDDCCAGNGDGRWMSECSAFLKPKKKEEMESLIARSKLRLLEEM